MKLTMDDIPPKVDRCTKSPREQIDRLPYPYTQKAYWSTPGKLSFLSKFCLKKEGEKKLSDIAKEDSVCFFSVKTQARSAQEGVGKDGIFSSLRTTADRKMKSRALFRSINFTPGRTKQPSVSDFSAKKKKKKIFFLFFCVISRTVYTFPIFFFIFFSFLVFKGILDR